MRAIYAVIILALCLPAALALADPLARISAPGALDIEFMQAQRQRVDDVARQRLGRQLSGAYATDIGILQDLLDRRLVKPEQTLELQAMGVVLGDLLAKDLGMQWIIYQDKIGRSRALGFADNEHRLFPVTMISRRAEAGAKVDVSAIYQKAYKLMLPYRRKLPFQ